MHDSPRAFGAHHRTGITSAVRHVAATTRSLICLVLLVGLVGCGGAYTIEGRVIRGTMGMVMLVDPDDQMLDGQGIAGAQIRVIRDPGRLSRKEVASTVSDGTGRFVLRIDTFGAGVTSEEWLFLVRRGGTAGAEGTFRLPSRPERQRIAVTLAAGTPPDMDERWSSTSEDLMRDFERFR